MDDEHKCDPDDLEVHIDVLFGEIYECSVCKAIYFDEEDWEERRNG
jgi:hypothetical protein